MLTETVVVTVRCWFGAPPQGNISNFNPSWHYRGWLLPVWPLPSVCEALRSRRPPSGHILSASTSSWAAAARSAAAPPAGSTQPDAASPDRLPRTPQLGPCGAPEPGQSRPVLLPPWSSRPDCCLAGIGPPPRPPAHLSRQRHIQHASGWLHPGQPRPAGASPAEHSRRRAGGEAAVAGFPLLEWPRSTASQPGGSDHLTIDRWPPGQPPVRTTTKSDERTAIDTTITYFVFF